MVSHKKQWSGSSSSSSSSSHHSRHHHHHDNYHPVPVPQPTPQPTPDFVRHFTTDITLIPVEGFGSNDGTFTIQQAMVNQAGRQVHLNVYDDLGRFFTNARPAVFRFNLPVPTTIDQASAGVALFSDDETASTGDAAAHAETYNTGTISQAGNVITGLGTEFDRSMVGGTIRFNSGQTAIITGFTSPTSITVDRTANIIARPFTLQFSYGQVYLIGPDIDPETRENSQLTFDLHYII